MFNYMIGQTIDRYRVVALLGEGRLGTVLKAHDPNLQRDVAIKLIDLNTLGQADAGEKLLQRARTAARLDHPGLVKVHDFGRLNGLLYVVMDYVPGGNLRQLLLDLRANNQWLPLGEAVGLIRSISLTLDYLNRQGVPARGVKPSDIMLKPEAADGLPYRPVLTSLGLSGESEGDWLPAAERVETPAYAYWSPEQTLGEAIDARGQVYSLGVLLYELAVGWQPFPVKTISEAVRAHGRSAPPAPRARRADLPVPLEGVILRALEKDPAARYPDPAALVQALDEVQTLITAAGPDASAGAWMVSLLVAYQRSLAEMTRAAPAVERPVDPSATVAVTQGRIKIVGPGGAVRYVKLTTRGLTIGRDPSNELVLTDGAVAGQHARVEFDGRRFKVLDLNSAAGTFLGGAKLVAGMAEVWTPPAPLLIGDSWLYLESGDAPEPAAQRPAVFNFGGAMVDANLVQLSATGRVGVYVEVPQLSLTPGQKTTAAVIITNQGGDADHFSVVLSGLPPNWLVPPAPPTSLALPSGGDQRLRLTFDPPRTPQTRAGRYTLLVRVSSQAHPTETVEAKLSLTLPAFGQFASEINPALVNVNEPVRLNIQNQGNTAEVYTVGFEDPAGELLFDPPGFQLTVPEGHTGVSDFLVSVQRPRLIGSRRQQPFAVRVSDAAGTAQRHTAELVSYALVPPWILLVVVFLGCLLTAVVAYAALDYTNRASATGTAAVTQTAAALAAGDADSDGLSNLEEVQRGTDALNPDTDGDGLKDGDELIWGANPLVADTDGDTLPDGQEVNVLHSSPINPDTDGDGLNDNVDPEPGLASTPTPSPTLTATPTTTATPATPTLTSEVPTATDTATPPAATATVPAATPTDTLPAPTATDTVPAATATASATTAGPVVPPGGVILFNAERLGAPNVYQMYSDGSNQLLLSAATPSSAANSHAQFAPTTHRLVFQSNRDGNDEIYAANADGTTPVRLTNNSAGDSDPVWSPDGSRIAFVSDRDGNPEIYVMLADGSVQARLTNNTFVDNDPIWSPDGTRLVFVSERDGNAELYTMLADGTGQTRLTTNTVADREPVWAPNGGWLVFTRDVDANADVWLMAATGGSEIPLTTAPGKDSGAVWAPNGAYIAFTSERDGNPEVYRMGATGSDQTRLTNSGGRDALPVWSPDSLRLAFVSERDGNAEVYVMNLDGAAQTRLTNDGAKDEPAQWLP